MGSEVRSLGATMLNMFDMWNSVTTKLEAQTNVQQSQQPHTSGGSIKGNFQLIEASVLDLSGLAEHKNPQKYTKIY